jgi:hypothetical protein
MDRLDSGRAAAWQAGDTGDGQARTSRLSLAGLRFELASSDPAMAAVLNWLDSNKLSLILALAVLVLLPALLTCVPALKSNLPQSTAAAYLAGFTCLAGEIVLAWKLQALTGQLYLLVALLTAVVLGGLFLGIALSASWFAAVRHLEWGIVLVLLAVLLLSCCGGFNPLSMAALWGLASLLSIGCGVVLGQALADPHSAPVKLYAADLLGSALAALFVGTLGMLVLGAASCLILLILGWLTLFITRKLFERRAGIMSH